MGEPAQHIIDRRDNAALPGQRSTEIGFLEVTVRTHHMHGGAVGPEVTVEAPETCVVHADRLEDTRAQNLLEGLSSDAFNRSTQQLKSPVVIDPSRPGFGIYIIDVAV